MISSDLTSNLIVTSTTTKGGVDQEKIPNCHIVLTMTPYCSKNHKPVHFLVNLEELSRE